MRSDTHITILFSMPEKDSVGYVPIHSISNAVCHKYQDVLLHPVAFCSMQGSMLFLLFWPTILCAADIWAKGSKFKAQCYDEVVLVPSNGVVFTSFTRRVHMNAPLLWYSQPCKWKVSESSKFTKPWELIFWCISEYIVILVVYIVILRNFIIGLRKMLILQRA